MMFLLRIISGALILGAMVCTGAPAVTPPLPPLPPSPVATFRAMLAMPAERRARALAERPEKQREFLRQRLAEYEGLPAGRREERLRATDLYWHLQQLIRRVPAERGSLVDAAPADLKPILRERLSLWDRLSPADQALLLEHERAIRYFARLRESPPPPLPGVNLRRSPAVSMRLQAELAPFEGLTSEEIRRVHRQWKEFFDASPPRAQETLQAMSEGARREMNEVLARFGRLPASQREACIDSFARLAALPAAERAGFLRSAERWQALSPEERANWRQIVMKLPPLPPISTRAPLPSLPPVGDRPRV